METTGKREIERERERDETLSTSWCHIGSTPYVAINYGREYAIATWNWCHTL